MHLILKKGLKMIVTHIIALAVTLFLIIVFGWVVEKWGFYFFSIISSLIYAGLFYSDAWNWGRLEGREWSTVKSNPSRALTASAISGILPLIFVILIFANINNPVTSIVAKVWYFPFIGFS